MRHVVLIVFLLSLSFFSPSLSLSISILSPTNNTHTHTLAPVLPACSISRHYISWLLPLPIYNIVYFSLYRLKCGLLDHSNT